MSRIEKGDYGYFRNQRQKKLIIMVLLYAMTLVMYFGAKAYFGTNRNLFTILAVLVVLPAAKYTVQFIMLVRAGECSSGVRDEVEQHIGHLSGAYDLYFTSEKKNYNNHPFYGQAGKTRFALAHNGVIGNDDMLRRSYKLKKTKIETDSYIAVQLLEYKKCLDMKSIRFMAEALTGSFSFSIYFYS